DTDPCPPGCNKDCGVATSKPLCGKCGGAFYLTCQCGLDEFQQKQQHSFECRAPQWIIDLMPLIVDPVILNDYSFKKKFVLYFAAVFELLCPANT
ncbi:19809_t:CDS:2, partial [Racocetra persica]